MSLASRLWLHGAEVGARPRLVGRPHIHVEGELRIGDDFVLRSLPVRSHLVVGAGGRLTIGDRVAIDQGAAVTCLQEITIGDGARVGPLCVLLDSDFHEVKDHSALGAPKPIQIGARARLGARVTVLRGASIGEGAIIEPGSTVSRALPPGARAGGVPARVLGDASTPRVTAAGDLGEIVPRAVMAALRLAEPPQLTATRRLYPQWDALAAARIAALIEEELGVELPRAEIASASSVAEIADHIARAIR